MVFQNILWRAKLAAHEAIDAAQRLFRSPSARARPPRELELRDLEDRILLSAVPAAIVGETFDSAPLDPAAGDLDPSETLATDVAEVARLQDALHDGPNSGESGYEQDSTADDASDFGSLQDSRVLQTPEVSTAAADIRHELVFIDTSTRDYQQLLDDLWTHAAADRQIDVVLLSNQRDGIDQISETLSQYDDLDAIHIVSHGTDGAVKLGGTWLNLDNVGAYAGGLVAWRDALATDADLLFYGCDLAASDDGQLLVESLGTLTGADVAASIDDTGHALLGGDWQLEYSLGNIETAIAFSIDVQQNWLARLEYLEANASWAATAAGTWQVKDLSAFGVPDNAVAEIAITNSENQDNYGGVRAFGSSLDRRLTIAPSGGGDNTLIMHVQVDSSGRIEQYSENIANVQFTLLGYWDSGTYVESFDTFNVTVDDTWQDRNLDVYGVGAGDVAEIVMANTNQASGNTLGVRTDGSALSRTLALANAGSGGEQSTTLFVQAGATAAATIEAYGSQSGQTSFHFIGHWSVAPGTYTEAYNDIGDPTASAAFLDKDLSGFGVSGNTVVEITLGNGSNQQQFAGVRENGSSVDRRIEFQKASNGSSLGRMHVTADATSTIEWYYEDISRTPEFYLTGYWATAATNVLVVDTTSDVADGDASSIAALLSDKGADGFVSLREAIEATNATPNIDSSTPDEIYFAIGSGLQTIVVDGSSGPYANGDGLDYIIDPVIIDATTQPGYTGAPLIQLDGSGANGSSAGLWLRTSDSTVRGFIVHSFPDEGIEIDGTLGPANNNVVQNNWIGINAAGAAAPNADEGVLITDGASNNLIGGTGANDGNVISGNTGDGIQLRDNLVGGTSDNTIEGNYIGLNVAGTAALGNHGQGIYISDGANDNTIGGTVAGAGNVISGNGVGSSFGMDGIFITGTGSDDNIIQGNYIGTDHTGTIGLGNLDDGISIQGGARNNIIGGNTAAHRNVIADAGAGNVLPSNHDGVYLEGLGTTGNAIQGNYIGTDVTGTLNLGSGGYGIRLWDQAGDNTIGGTDPGEGNVIAHSTLDGVALEATTGSGNRIIGNAIYDSGGLGIDLENDGVTANDTGDADTGSNNLLNFPVLTRAIATATDIAIDGSLNAAATATYDIHFYSSGSLDPSGYGEGQNYLGSITVVTDGSGNASFRVTLPVVVPEGAFIAATATDASGNTSEFSLGFGVSTLTSPSGAALWLSTDGNVPSNSGASGMESWSDGMQLAFGGLGLDFEPGTTAGTLHAVVDADAFADVDVNVRGTHYVSRDITVGGANSFDLLIGDVLMSLGVDATLTSTNSISVTKEDVFVFRPDTPGDYSSGTFILLLDNAITKQIHSISLVEQDTTVGDTVLSAGTFILNEKSKTDILHFTADNVGEGTTSGTTSILIAGGDIGLDKGIDGLELIEAETIIGGTTLPAGSILVTLEDNDVVADNNLSVTQNDIFYLTVTKTTLVAGNADATATLFFEGSDAGLDTAAEDVDAIALVSGNTSPAITLPGGPVSYTENDAATVIDGAATVSDPDSTDFDTGTLTVDFTANGTANDRLAIRNEGTGAGQIGVSGSNVTYEGITIGTFTGGTDGSTPLVITFNSNSTPAAAQALLQNITYENVSSNPATSARTVRFLLTDGDGGTSNSPTETINVASLGDSLLLSTIGNVGSPSGAPGLDAWTDGEIIEFGDPNLTAEPGTTDGTFSSFFEIDDFTADGDANIDAIHYVNRNITVGGGANTEALQVGDLLLSTNAVETVSPDGTPVHPDAITVDPYDVFVFRPDTPGDYRSGTFVFLLDDISLSNDIVAISLVEQNTLFGDIVLQEGSLLYGVASGGEKRDVIEFDPTGVGLATTSGTTTTIIAGDDIGIGSGSIGIGGFHLVQAPVTLGGANLAAGNLIVTLTLDDASVGANSISVADDDVFYFDVTATTAGSGVATATATLLLEGADVGLSDPTENPDGIALFSTTVGTNTAPTISLPAGPVNYTENGAATLVDSTATAADPDSPDLDGGQLHVNFAAGGTANDRLAIRDQGPGVGNISISGSDVRYDFGSGPVVIGTFAGGTDGFTPLVVTFNTNATPVAAQALMRNLTYENVSDAPSTAARSVRFVLTDGDGGTSNAATQTVNITAVNDAPSVTTSPFALAYTEGDGAVAVDPGVTISDVDSSQLTAGVVRLLADYVPGEDLLAFTNQLGITGIWNSGSGQMALTGTASVADYQTAMRSITYENLSDSPDTTTRTIRFIAYDGALSGIDDRNIDVTAVNDAPQLDLDADDSSGAGGADFATVLTEDGGPVAAADADATLTDADDTNLQSLTVTITNLLDGLAESLAADTSGTGITAGYDALTGVLTLSGSDTVANYQQVLRSVQYNNTSQNPNTTDRVLQVVANDGSDASNLGMVTVAVNAVNDDPVITSNGGGATASVSVAENNLAVTTVTASDIDTDTPAFSITGGDDQLRFNIDNVTGVLTFHAAPDFEVPTDTGANNVYEVIVTASDGNGGSDTQLISVTVTDENDNAPVITPGQSLGVAEDAANGTSLGSVAATDADTVGSLQDWTIVGGNMDGVFAIDPLSGEITIADNTNLDFETTPGYTLTLTVGDGTNTSAPQTVTINVTDVGEWAVGPISDTDLAPDSVAENALPGAEVGITAFAADPDVMDSVTYSLDDSAGGRFTIDLNTGVITLAGGLDFESNTSHNVTVRATSTDSGSSTRTFTINVTDVNDNAPVITPGQSFSVAEDAANGTSLGTVAATDADTVGSLQDWTIVGGNTDGVFAIDPLSGQITIADNTNLDFETTPGYTLTLTVGDGANTSAPQTVTINITDVGEGSVGPISDTDLAPDSAVENALPGAAVGVTAFADDPDVMDSVTYSLDDNAGGRFTIDLNTGVIMLAGGLDFETNTSHNVTVRATSTDSSSSTRTFTINVTDVNDNAPVITPGQFFSVAEDAVNGTSLGTVAATDADTVGSLHDWTIVGGNTDGVFAIDPLSGQITIADNTNLDYETTPGYSLMLTVSDGLNTSVAVAVTVHVDNVNEAPAGAVPGAQVTAEDTPLVFSLSGGNAITVSDVDAGSHPILVTLTATNGTLTLGSITGLAFDTGDGANDAAMRFVGSLAEINAALEGLTFTPALNFQGGATLQITVDDQGYVGLGGAEIDSDTINISVTPVNDAPVVGGAAFALDEHSAAATSVGTVSATDPDAGDTLTYRIAGGSGSGVFGIDPSSGEITVVDPTALVYETNPAFDLAVEVEDAATATGTATVTISLININQPPAATADLYVLEQGSVLTVTAPGVLANDVDPEGGPLTVLLVSGTAHGTLTLGANGSLSYTPPAGFYGADAFTYRLSDSWEQSGAVTVTIEVRPVTPPTVDDLPDDGPPDDEGDSDDEAPDEEDSLPPTSDPPPTNDDDHTDRGRSTPPSPGRPPVTDGLAPPAPEEVSADAWLLSDDVLTPVARESEAGSSAAGDEGDAPDPPATVDDGAGGPPAEQSLLWNQLDAFQHDLLQDLESQHDFQTLIVGTSAVGVTGLTVGYVVWLIRGGSLLATMISTLPAWASIDPLPVLESFEASAAAKNGQEEDDITFESLVMPS